MKTTKKEIKSGMTTKKGNGWNPAYSFKFQKDGMSFEKPFNFDTTFVVNRENGHCEAEYHTYKKADFINAVYDYFKNLSI